MKYKIKNRGNAVAMLTITIIIACLGMGNVGANMPEKYPSTEGAILGVVLFFVGGFIALMICLEWEHLKVTDFDKAWKDEINERVKEKLRQITREINKTDS